MSIKSVNKFSQYSLLKIRHGIIENQAKFDLKRVPQNIQTNKIILEHKQGIPSMSLYQMNRH